MKIRKKIVALCLAAVMLVLAGCSMLSEEQVKLQDIGFTVVSEEKQPEELKTIIGEKKGSPFQFTYNDSEYLYIVIGYGEQPEGGYSIAVNDLYLTEDNIYVNTTLLGPDAADNKGAKAPSYPYIVLKMDYLDKPVVFE
ncbi:MAG: protease complex subunit PrcB family protein [Lachnospiraceae bacterium]|nr:protease complex subunit PrcB family protein [Lachnospiraceae bacterium]